MVMFAMFLEVSKTNFTELVSYVSEWSWKESLQYV